MDLIADSQSTEEIVPAVGTLNDPATSFESRVALAFLFFLSSRLDVFDVPATRCRATQLRVVVTFVAAKMLKRFLLGRWTGHHDRIQGGSEQFHIVPVGTRERDRQGDTVGVRKDVPLGAQFSAIGGVFSGLVPPLTGAGMIAESSDWYRQSMPLRSS